MIGTVENLIFVNYILSKFKNYLHVVKNYATRSNKRKSLLKLMKQYCCLIFIKTWTEHSVLWFLLVLMRYNCSLLNNMAAVVKPFEHYRNHICYPLIMKLAKIFFKMCFVMISGLSLNMILIFFQRQFPGVRLVLLWNIVNTTRSEQWNFLGSQLGERLRPFSYFFLCWSFLQISWFQFLSLFYLSFTWLSEFAENVYTLLRVKSYLSFILCNDVWILYINILTLFLHKSKNIEYKLLVNVICFAF